MWATRQHQQLPRRPFVTWGCHLGSRNVPLARQLDSVSCGVCCLITATGCTALEGRHLESLACFAKRAGYGNEILEETGKGGTDCNAGLLCAAALAVGQAVAMQLREKAHGQSWLATRAALQAEMPSSINAVILLHQDGASGHYCVVICAPELGSEGFWLWDPTSKTLDQKLARGDFQAAIAFGEPVQGLSAVQLDGIVNTLASGAVPAGLEAVTSAQSLFHSQQLAALPQAAGAARPRSYREAVEASSHMAAPQIAAIPDQAPTPAEVKLLEPAWLPTPTVSLPGAEQDAPSALPAGAARRRHRRQQPVCVQQQLPYEHTTDAKRAKVATIPPSAQQILQLAAQRAEEQASLLVDICGQADTNKGSQHKKAPRRLKLLPAQPLASPAAKPPSAGDMASAGSHEPVSKAAYSTPRACTDVLPDTAPAFRARPSSHGYLRWLHATRIRKAKRRQLSVRKLTVGQWLALQEVAKRKVILHRSAWPQRQRRVVGIRRSSLAYGRSQHVAPNAVSVQVWASFAAAKKLMLQMLMARTQDGFILRGAGGSDGGQECGPEGGQASVGHAGRERAEDAPDDNSSGNPETSVEDLSKLKLSEFVASRDQVNAMWRAKDVRIPRY
ncbi:hypothetical protein WJX72_005950 [[Myrmecia] bisecta]|uniref:Peptidase C39 domain-containing protein n=1 Tax=[Myrmecia] bisecta TaxID=41462 RepID=A0AAW1PK13_9CHLO